MTSRAGSSCPLPRIRRAGSPFGVSASGVIRWGAPLACGRAGLFSRRFSGWFSLEETGSMPFKPTLPGVYIEEIPSGVRTVTGVATSIAAFVGHFPKGLQNEAVHIFSAADFEREYGGIDRDSPARYAVQQFFLNGGGEAHVVRVAHDARGGIGGASWRERGCKY